MNEGQTLKFLGGVSHAREVDALLERKLGAEWRIPRLVFAGRSNVGKSSLLNALTKSKLARVSSEPGKTREMNFFRWMYGGKPWVLVDLPGYGYAKVAKKLRAQWGEEISTWLKDDHFIACVVALADGRHGFMENDVELVRFLQSENIPHVVAFTKMDKWKSSNQQRVAEKELAEKAALLNVEDYLFVSSQKLGKDADGTRSLREYFLSLKA